MSTRRKNRKLNAQLQEDVDFLANLLANGISGLMTIGIAEGFKMKGAMERVMKNKVSTELFAELLVKFFEVNPQASAAVEMAAAWSPKLGEFLEKLRLKPKDVAADDVEVRDEKKA